jgi:hydrophobe/amphiphile efflux-1 (HAE1) family protein
MNSADSAPTGGGGNVQGVTPPAGPRAGEEDVTYFFVKRPIFAMVISLVIVLLGLFSLRTLPINTYPRITPPSVQITATFPGATSEQVCIAVAAPIEQQLPGIQGLAYYKTSCASDGSMVIQAYFDISRDLDLAAVDVQNRVQIATPQIPLQAQQLGITVLKAQTDILMGLALTSDDPRWDAAALTNYAKIYITDELSRVDGVGQANTFGALQFAMLVSLDPDKMAHLGLTVTDVIAAINEQNTTNPSGRIGREPAPVGTQFTVPVTAIGRLSTPEEFSNIILRAQPDGSVLHIRDVGTVTLGSQSYDNVTRLNGKPTAGVIVFLRAGANALAAKDGVMARMTELAKHFPPNVHWVVGFDLTPFITASIHEVEITLFIAIILVTIVVYIFLQKWRSTLIPALAVPVSIIGTFFGMAVLGFTVNLLTLFGLVLSIGIVVDDAIIVIENVERIMQDEHVSARVAADRAIRQLRGALIAIVIVLCSVFIPVAFIGGITGALYKQFAVTIVISVVLSGCVALSLTPALCSVLLTEQKSAPQGGFFGWFNRTFDKARDKYVETMHKVSPYSGAAVGVLVVAVCIIIFLYKTTPSGFLPSEDKGYFITAVELPGSSSTQRTTQVVERVEKFLLHQPGVDHVFGLSGFSLIQGVNQTSSATLFGVLAPWDDRKKKTAQVDGLLQSANGYFFTQIPEAFVFSFNAPEIIGLGTTSGMELNLQDRGINDVGKFAALSQQFAQDLAKTGVVTGVNTTIRADAQQLYLDVDREKVKSLGVSLTDVFTTLQTMLAYDYVNDFNLYGKTYHVQLEAQAPFRQRPEDIGKFYVRSASGVMVPISSLVRTSFRAGPTVVTRFNGFTSALVIGTPAPGKSSGQMLDAAKKLIKDKYEALNVGYSFSGESYQEEASSGSGGIVFGLGLMMAFLVLAAQYESWSTPLAVMIGVPFGILGAFLGLFVLRHPNDLYFDVGLLVVIGLEAKNAILMVEFAIEQRAAGKSIEEAAVEAGRERIRPILMTSFAFILGVVPLVIATGAGAAARHSLGIGVFFGMLVSTLLGVSIIPNLFIFVRKLSERMSARRHGTPALAPARGVLPAPAGDD